MLFSRMRIIKSVFLVEDGWLWLPLGRSGWKGKTRVKVPSRDAIRVNATTLLMHPAAVRELRELTRHQET